jgi:hypothetical protein
MHDLFDEYEEDQLLHHVQLMYVHLPGSNISPQLDNFPMLKRAFGSNCECIYGSVPFANIVTSMTVTIYAQFPFCMPSSFIPCNLRHTSYELNTTLLCIQSCNDFCVS